MSDEVAYLTSDGTYYTDSSMVPRVGESVMIAEWNYVAVVESVEYTVNENSVTANVELTDEVFANE